MAQNGKSGQGRAFDASFILAMILTAAFYVVMYLPSMRGSILQHYTTEHVVEYVIVALFVWGIVDIVLKLCAFPREIMALRQDWLPARQGREPMANAHVLLQQIREKPHWLLESRVGKRLVFALEYVTEKCSAKDYREHLRYLAEQDEDANHASYVLIRFVIGVTPVLGFLGTVIHFGTALSGISFDEMTEKLPTVVGEMGTAFNTTSVALVAAMTMMFSLFLCQRIERSITRSIDRLVDRELLKRFEFKDPSITPFLTSLQSANEEALAAINSTLGRQIEVWVAALDSVFQRFDQRQGNEVQNWQHALEVIEERHQAYDTSREEQLRQSLLLAESRQEAQFAEIQSLVERAVSLRDDFSAFMKTLDNIARGEGKLVELQETLSENLRAIHETQQIDKALHGLTAAIHLLTARQYQSGPHSAAA
ncbi:MAG TPA: MotA/TolQ/ExbB proton channel family protein [Planctomycetaceae bacterium]|jgi:biopolymer transport protein ExbB/TolQ|nr:MotA/TolQ/ExbB proton channel family protein [Planctomycetaceae bacterium]